MLDVVSWPASVSVNISAMISSSSRRVFGSPEELALTSMRVHKQTSGPKLKYHDGRTVLTQDAHDVLAGDLLLRVYIGPLLPNNLPTVLLEQVVEVAETRERVHWDIFDQLEDRHRDVVP